MAPSPRKSAPTPRACRQVLINLVANAIKFTKTGSVTLTVGIKPNVSEKNPSLEIQITDTGIGIAEDKLASLFKPFVQGDASITRQFGGSGLGLAISKFFAKALGGDIKVTSTPNTGSTFTVTVLTDYVRDVAVEENPTDAMENKTNFAGPKVRINGSVLVAEDGIDNQALITHAPPRTRPESRNRPQRPRRRRYGALRP